MRVRSVRAPGGEEELSGTYILLAVACENQAFISLAPIHFDFSLFLSLFLYFFSFSTLFLFRFFFTS